MLPVAQRIAFLAFAVIAIVFGAAGMWGVVARILRGRADADRRGDQPVGRLLYALKTTLTQNRTFRTRPFVGIFHSFIFYGFVFYLLVNLVDALEGYFPFRVQSTSLAGALYNLFADVFSFLVLAGVVALVVRRFFLPGRRDFSFNPRTLLDARVQTGVISRDSLIVSAFILFHVGSRALGSAARRSMEGPDRLQPFATTLSRVIPQGRAHGLEIFAYWGALGSVLAFLAYFPRTKHLHLFAAPVKYFFRRSAASGTLPLAEVDVAGQEQVIGARRLEELSWPRLLDAYACIQCNRCQDVCPASATGKSLSPAAIEINKRMLLNRRDPKDSPATLLKAVLTPEALWACTTCGACMEVCPVQDEQMLDIIDIRRHQVMIEGEFPQQLQSAFRGMERAKNPWGINADQRMDWAAGLNVKTIEENPDPDVLYWVGCAASYDPQAQKTARSFVQLMNMAGINFAVLGKREGCTGDSARRAGNEYLYRQLAMENIATLNQSAPKQIVATCPHCFNSLGKEYAQLGGSYQVVHHTAFLDSLVAKGLLPKPASSLRLTYHDPCYLGRHNGVYDPPRNLLRVLGQEFIEMGRSRENSFCCGAGGAQFWKEEEPGEERVSVNRYREAQRTLASDGAVLAVGCPFCKSMLDSSPGREAGPAIQVKDIAELLLEALVPADQASTPSATAAAASVPVTASAGPLPALLANATAAAEAVHSSTAAGDPPAAEEGRAVSPRKKWQPKPASASHTGSESSPGVHGAEAEGEQPAETSPVTPVAAERKVWKPKAKQEPEL